jgi:starch synthase (maltosyl-transferring)
MNPWPGERLLRFAGDHLRFSVVGNGHELPDGFRALLRTNLGRAASVREEVIGSYAEKLPIAGASWRDIPMKQSQGHWIIDLCLTEIGYFQAKAYAVDRQGRQYWPHGANVGITVHPDHHRTSNTIYCAFTRMFGDSKPAASTRSESLEAQLGKLDKQGYTVIPPSGKLRDLLQQVPHIFDTLGCRVLHLLPVSPVPTTFARFGRFGSPYASEDLTLIDPALVEFDRRTTGIDQFRELTYAVHLRGGRVFLDIVTNHTGWGSSLQENHPEWFLRDQQGNFVSPGAWGVTWEDLVELDHRGSAPWDCLADVFLAWCRRGVDGFRCDAGYKVPMPAWRYITARVREEFPNTIFLLEGLGGSWEATESLLTDGGMQWAYSELFQNYTGSQVASYLDYSHRQSERAGLYVHYSETHDNDRLAKNGRAWSLLRNRLCALTSANGGYGFTCGVEWLASEKINVHSSTGMAWGSSDNLLPELKTLNTLLDEHPCFFDGATLTRLSHVDSVVYALRRTSAEQKDSVLVLVNTDCTKEQAITLERSLFEEFGEPRFDLLGQKVPRPGARNGRTEFILPPGACYCLSRNSKPVGLSGSAYRRLRACAAWGAAALSYVLPIEEIGDYSWQTAGGFVEEDPRLFLAAVSHLKERPHDGDFGQVLRAIVSKGCFPNVVVWQRIDLRRITLVPPGHWLLVQDDCRFRASLQCEAESSGQHVESIEVRNGNVACFAPRNRTSDAILYLERYAAEDQHLKAQVRFLGTEPANPNVFKKVPEAALVLLTNGIGGMSRLCVDLGRITSKYDCLLGANLHSNVPVDRHVFAKRARVWVNADGFISPLDLLSLRSFEAGPPARWHFIANAGDGRMVQICLEADMIDQRNITILRFSRPASATPIGKDLPEDCDVRLTVRIDIEDRNFHAETTRNPGADHHFTSNCRPLNNEIGFEFTPGRDRTLRVLADSGSYHHEAEWSERISHPIEQTRGHVGHADAYSPGWFNLPMAKGANVMLSVAADAEPLPLSELREFDVRRKQLQELALQKTELPKADPFGRQLARAIQSFVVRRDTGKTIIAGYPWFLDWGRDSLICARGLLAAGLHEEVRQLLVTFGRFEANGTLPNSIHGDDASNRDTSDAPLWFGVVCEDAAKLLGDELYQTPVGARTLTDVLHSIAEGYLRGTPNGICVDSESALVWSPRHFTWMDTNFPAGTPREGYPIEIQVLWIRLLKQLSRLGVKSSGAPWQSLADRAESSLLKYFWLEEKGYFADLLIGKPGQTASGSVVDNALRSNFLFAVSLGLVTGEEARRSVDAALRYLTIPGALRSLAPLPVSPPSPVIGNDGRLLNDPGWPYWGRYEGDEDTRRKPAYHNGTAWTWTFPTCCEALGRAWDFQPEAVAAARAYLSSMDRFLVEGCFGHIPEILDGDAPHQPRGCDAQAWGTTEALRVWKLLIR